MGWTWGQKQGSHAGGVRMGDDVHGEEGGIRSRDGMTICLGGRVRNRVIGLEALVG